MLLLAHLLRAPVPPIFANDMKYVLKKVRCNVPGLPHLVLLSLPAIAEFTMCEEVLRLQSFFMKEMEQDNDVAQITPSHDILCDLGLWYLDATVLKEHPGEDSSS